MGLFVGLLTRGSAAMQLRPHSQKASQKLGQPRKEMGKVSEQKAEARPSPAPKLSCCVTSGRSVSQEEVPSHYVEIVLE